ncbi:hypothetical protein GCM10018952_68070 [Streptosporangium vulgare]
MPRKHAAITGCVLAITALTATAVPAAAHPLTTGVATTAVTLKPPPGMIAALQRDLHLTQEQAQARLLNETRLAPVAAQLRTKLGARFGGAWFAGTVAQTLVVTTTDSADLPQIIAAGARGEVVDLSLQDLHAALAVTNASLSRNDGSVRFIDVKSNQVVVLTKEPLAAEDKIEASGVSAGAVRAVQSHETPQLLGDVVNGEDLAGGDAYYIGVRSRCSVGFSVTKGVKEGFVSAGHCGTAGDTTSGFNRAPQGVFQASTFPNNDFSWVEVNSNWTPQPWVGNGAGEVVKVSGSRAAIVGASVCRSGSTTGWHCGTVQQLHTSVAYNQGNVFELTRTNVCAETRRLRRLLHLHRPGPGRHLRRLRRLQLRRCHLLPADRPDPHHLRPDPENHRHPPLAGARKPAPTTRSPSRARWPRTVPATSRAIAATTRPSAASTPAA